MTDLNSVCLIGRLVKKPELKKVGADGSFGILEFTIAVNKTYKNKDQFVDKVSFIDCKAVGKFAENRAQAGWMDKGTLVYVTGRIEQDKWEKDGQSYSRIIIECTEVLPVPSAKKASSGEAAEKNEVFENGIDTTSEADPALF